MDKYKFEKSFLVAEKKEETKKKYKSLKKKPKKPIENKNNYKFISN